MLELISAAYSIWGYIDDANTFLKIARFVKKYASFLRWYVVNPEVQLKYTRIITTKTTPQTIDKIHNSLIEAGKEFSGEFQKSRTKFNFELSNSKIGYRIFIDRVTETAHNLLIESKYFSYFPFRKFKRLNDITSEFNEVCEIICNPLKIGNINHVLFVEIKIATENKEVTTFKKIGAEVIFNGSKIQITGNRGTEHVEFLVFILLKWLGEYRESKKIS